MGLLEKIEEIRRQPEHIRLRYVWFWVSVCMLFVILVWFASLRYAQFSSQKDVILEEGADLFRDVEQQKESVTDATEKLKSSISDPAAREGATAVQKQR